MDETLFFGSFLIKCHSFSNLRSIVLDNWETFQKKKYPSLQTVILHIEEDSHLADQPPIDGWQIQYNNGHKQAAIGFSSKPFFALESGLKPYEVTIYSRGTINVHMKIGFQYGLLVALASCCVGLHGVTLLCGDEIIILSAPSGTGKTTLAGLLERYSDAIVINGDFALLRPTDEGVIFEPTPFCGTSGRALNHCFRVNRVVFLTQAKNNTWRNVDGREALAQFMGNAFIPTWDDEMQQKVQKNILRCLSLLKVNTYAFAPTQIAAEEFLKQVEKDSSLRSE